MRVKNQKDKETETSGFGGTAGGWRNSPTPEIQPSGGRKKTKGGIVSTKKRT